MSMLMTTTPTVEGRPVRQYLGVVTSEAVMGTNLFSDFFASVRDIVGGRSGSYEQILRDAKSEAMAELAGQAGQLGADAIVGISLSHQVIGGDKKTMLVVLASGTAVRLG